MNSDHEKRKSVQRMQDFIEDHLGKPITLADLARAARYSPYHAARMFKELTGFSPFKYIRARRLTAAAEALGTERSRVVDVAFDFVFDSHEGFTRAFSRQFGMSPSAYRKEKPEVSLFFPKQMRDFMDRRQKGETQMNEKTQTPDTVFVQVLERPVRKLLIRRGTKASHYFDYVEEVGCEVWETLVAIKEAIHEPMGLWLPETLQKEGTSPYVQGVELRSDYAGEIPDGFEIIDLKPCKMMVFQGQPFDDDDFEDAIKTLWDVINDYNPETVGYEWADSDAPRFQLEPHGYRGYIEGRPVRPHKEGRPVRPRKNPDR